MILRAAAGVAVLLCCTSAGAAAAASTSVRLRREAVAPAKIVDVDQSRIAWEKPVPNSPYSADIGLYSRETGAVQNLDIFGSPIPGQTRLVPGAVIFNNGQLQRWHDGTLDTLDPFPWDWWIENERYVVVMENWHISGFSTTGFAVYDLVAGTANGYPVPSVSSVELDSDGSGVYLADSSPSWYGFEGTQVQPINTYTERPSIDGGETLYPKAGSWYVHDGTKVTKMPTGAVVPGPYDIRSGWAVFTALDGAGQPQLWRRTPGSTSATAVAPWPAQNVLRGLAPNGEVVYRTAGATRLLGNGFDTFITDLALTSVKYVGGRWYASIDSTLFQFEPPNDDVGGDYRSDVLWRRSTDGAMETWNMNGGARTVTAEPAVATRWTASTGDFDGDGLADVLWRDAVSGRAAIWFRDRGAAWAPDLPLLPAFWEARAGDVDGNGTDDLVLRNTVNGQVTIWFIRDGRPVRSRDLPSVPVAWKLQVADFNADGRADVLWHNASLADGVIWFLDANSITGAVQLPAVGAPWEVYAGNFDGDAHADVFWRNTANGTHGLWLMRDGRPVKGGDPSSMTTNRKPYLGDFDGDGKTDILWHQRGAEPVSLWMMNGTAIASVSQQTHTAGYEILNLR